MPCLARKSSGQQLWGRQRDAKGGLWNYTTWRRVVGGAPGRRGVGKRSLGLRRVGRGRPRRIRVVGVSSGLAPLAPLLTRGRSTPGPL